MLSGDASMIFFSIRTLNKLEFTNPNGSSVCTIPTALGCYLLQRKNHPFPNEAFKG